MWNFSKESENTIRISFIYHELIIKQNSLSTRKIGYVNSMKKRYLH